jgi:hypothetical protein
MRERAPLKGDRGLAEDESARHAIAHKERIIDPAARIRAALDPGPPLARASPDELPVDNGGSLSDTIVCTDSYADHRGRV